MFRDENDGCNAFGSNEEEEQRVDNEGVDLLAFARAQVARELEEEVDRPKRDSAIGNEDIVNLKIALESTKSVDMFLELTYI